MSPTTTPQSRLKDIIRSTTIVGGSSVIVLAIGIVRSKVFALLLGPSGIGLIGLLNSFVAAAATFGALGTGTSGVNSIARSNGDDHAVTLALRLLNVILGLVVALAVALLRQPLAVWLGDPSLAASIGWLAIAIFFSIVVIGQGAIITGRRRFRDLATLQIGGTAFGAALAIALVISFGSAAIVPALIVTPAATFLVGLWLLRRRMTGRAQVTPGTYKRHWLDLLSLGVPVMCAALVGSLIQVAMRALILQQWGLPSVGLYQAVFALTSLNLGLVLSALGADYFPRLSAAGLNDADLSRLSNEQMRVVCLLSAPTLVILSAGAQWWLPLFYSDQFSAAENLMRLQLIGEACRIPAWVYGFVLLARRDTRAYLVHEASNAVVLPMTWLLIPHLGLDGAGLAFTLSYIFCASVTIALVHRRHGITVDAMTWLFFTGLIGLLASLAFIVPLVPSIAPIGGCLIGAAVGLAVLHWLKRHGALPQPVQSIVDRLGSRTNG